jgi:hypothetical protein
MGDVTSLFILISGIDSTGSICFVIFFNRDFRIREYEQPVSRNAGILIASVKIDTVGTPKFVFLWI